MNIMVLSFSSRRNGNCANISQFISNYYAQDDVSMCRIDHEIISPCGRCDYECLRAMKSCPNMTAPYKSIMDTIIDSDLVYFVIPNYCGFPCANYFAFNERSVGYFDMDQDTLDRYMGVRKRFIVVGNGGEFEQALQQQTMDKPEILYLQSRRYHKKSIDGDLLESDAAREYLREFLAVKATPA